VGLAGATNAFAEVANALAFVSVLAESPPHPARPIADTTAAANRKRKVFIIVVSSLEQKNWQYGSAGQTARRFAFRQKICPHRSSTKREQILAAYDAPDDIPDSQKSRPSDGNPDP
jgi:hypothetical protein